MRRILQKLSPHELEFITINSKDPEESIITSDKIWEMNNYGDMLLVGGGGMFMAGDGYKTVSDWQFNISKHGLSELRIPLVVYALGWNVFPYDKTGLTSFAIGHIKETYKTASLFSVRNLGSHIELQNRGIPSVRCIPDPGYFCIPSDIKLPGIYRDTYCVGICWPGDRPELRTQGTVDTKTQIAKFCHQINEFLFLKSNSKVVYIPHVAKYDLDPEIIQTFQEELGDKFYNVAKELPFLYPEKLEYVSVIAGIYKQMDVAIGMRGHGCMIPYGLGVPVVAYGEHNKVKFFAGDTGSPWAEWQKDDDLKRALKEATAGTIFRNKQLAVLDKFRQESKEFNQQVIMRLNGYNL
tara:strand:+ start:265 stop:1320 length:1056 start_codon:yes stop_codon:yes gene_type:complete